MCVLFASIRESKCIPLLSSKFGILVYENFKFILESLLLNYDFEIVLDVLYAMGPGGTDKVPVLCKLS